MCFSFFFFPQNFCAAVLVPRWEREQCLSEINTTQRESWEGERERAGVRGGGRRGRKGGIKEDRADKHKSDFFFLKKRGSLKEKEIFLEKRQRITRETQRGNQG